MKFNPKTILLSFIASLVLVKVTAQESDTPKPYRIVISSDFPTLGAIYPRSGFNPEPPGMQEGDTPTFLQLVSAIYGKNDPEKPDQES